LAAKPQIVAANKMDAVDDASRVTALERHASELDLPFFRISGATGEGISPLLEAMWRGLSIEAEVSASSKT
jgi:GTP-binding protein